MALTGRPHPGHQLHEPKGEVLPELGSEKPPASRRGRGGAWTEEREAPREPKGRGDAWTEEREARNERRATREGIASKRPGGERE